MAALTAKQYREDRAPVAHKIREMADLVNAEGRDFTAEEQGTWDALNADYDKYTRSIELAERAETVTFEQEALIEETRKSASKQLPGRDDVSHRETTIEKRGEREEVTEEHRSLALSGWMRAKYDLPLEERHKKACELVGIQPHAQREYQLSFRTGDYNQVRRECRALSGVTDTAGAYTIPKGFVNNLETAMLAFGGMRQVADVLRTAEGNDLPWPTSDDTSNEGVRIGENTTVSEQDISFGAVVFQAYKYSSKLVKVPRELLEDSAIDIAAYIGTQLGERIGRITNREFTTGSGAAQPKGIVTASALGVTAASATAITADELIDLVHSIDPSYRSQGCGWMMHDGVLKAIRKLKDGNGQYLWQPGMTAGQPDMLFNFPITINQHMQSSVASATKTVLFGLLSKYKIRDVAGFRLRRLEERYADADQEGFLAFSRHDGNLLDAGTNPVKHLLQNT